MKGGAGLLAFGGQEQHVRSTDPQVKARLHDGPGGTYLPVPSGVWVANPTRRPRPLRLTLGSAWGPFSARQTVWGATAEVHERTITLTAPARDVTLIELVA